MSNLLKLGSVVFYLFSFFLGYGTLLLWKQMKLLYTITLNQALPPCKVERSRRFKKILLPI